MSGAPRAEVPDAATASTLATVLYDASCGLCDASVRWLRARDRRGVLRFVASDSEEGARALRAVGLDPDRLDSVVLVSEGRAWRRSSAVLEALRRIGPPWSLAAAARVLPESLRDAAYRAIARHRHAWFGRIPPH